jgi:hypothetical protein
VCKSAYPFIVMVFFQTGKIPDLTESECAGESVVWRKIAKYQQTSPWRWHSLCRSLIFNLPPSRGVVVECAAAGKIGAGIPGAAVHHSPLRLYT